MTTERIRWERNDDGSSVTAAHEGYAGTISEPLFFIFEPDDRDPWWILTSSLPGLPGAGRAERRAHGADTDKLRAEAERWLAEFAVSLGASFPSGPVVSRCECGGLASHVHGCRWRQGYGSLIETVTDGPAKEAGQ